MNMCDGSPFHTYVRAVAAERRYKRREHNIKNECGNRGLTGDWNATESQASLHVKYILNVMVWRKDHGVGNKAIFMALHGTDHSGLSRRWLVMVYNADTAQQLHVAKAKE
jgi:hypothetical protein